jgi:hypothetical protein
LNVVKRVKIAVRISKKEIAVKSALERKNKITYNKFVRAAAQP